MRAILLLGILAVPAMLAAGFAYQYFGGRRDRRTLLDRSRLVELRDGTRLYVSCMGAGSPAVLFESGLGATSQNWLAMQRAMSRTTTAIAYDRAGLGWSGAARTERTPSNVARELHALLEELGVEPPCILVGHSFGGLVVRRYAIDFPEDVAGIVLVDPMRPEEWPPQNPERQALIDRAIRLSGIGAHLARFGLARLAANSLLRRSGRTSRAFSRAAGHGGRHVLDRVTCEINKLPRETWASVAAHWSSPRFFRGFQAHLRGVRATVCEMQTVPPLSTLVIQFTAATSQPLAESDFAELGDRATEVRVDGGHWVHLDEPELVMAAIESLVERAREAAEQSEQVMV